MEFVVYTVYGTMDIVLGITACLVSAALFLYPIPTFRKIVKEKSTGKLTPYHYVAYELAFLFWTLYSLPPKEAKSSLSFHNMCFMCTSMIGLDFYAVYMFIFYKCTTGFNSVIIKLGAIGQVLLILLPSVRASWYNTVMGPESAKVVGPVATIFGVIMYASTLPLAVDAWRHRRFDYWLFGLCTILCWNSTVWFAYGFCYSPTYDVYIAIANGCGVVLSVVQLILCVVPLAMHKESGITDDFPGHVQNYDIESLLLAK